MEILRSLNEKSLLLNLSFFDSQKDLLFYSNHYLFYMNEKFGIKVDLANEIKDIIANIDLNKNYDSEKIKTLQTIKQHLVADKIIRMNDFTKYQGSQLYSINHYPIPNLFSDQKIININIDKLESNDISLYKVDNPNVAALCAYERTVALLESGIGIDQIVILNSDREDDYFLKKVFSDAKLPISINKPEKLNKYPKVIKLLNILNTKGYLASKSYLESLVDKSPKKNYLDACIKLYNAYLDYDCIKQPEILSHTINNKSVTPSGYKNCINCNALNSFIYDEETYYILMNYSSNSLPIISKTSHYLSEAELESIDYTSEYILNQYYHQYTKNTLQSMKHLDLIFTRYTIEENRVSDLIEDRKIKTIEYEYKIKAATYLNNLNPLAYAKTAYDLNKYFIRDTNYDILHHNYKDQIKPYHHSFSGIDKPDLDELLRKHHTITGYKLDAFFECRFKFLLQNLLQIDAFSTNVNIYLGNMIHKALEEFTKNSSCDIEKLVDQFPGFPEEIDYKEQLYKAGVKKDLKALLPLVSKLHESTMFSDIRPEVTFELPFKKDPSFKITGIIDKVLIHKLPDKTEYFAIIDYKLGNKDFKLADFEKHMSMQLPMYMYAYINREGKDINPVGFFYQKTSLGRYKQENDAIKKNFKLKGLGLNNQTLLETLCPAMDDFQTIRLTSTGKLTGKSRLITASEFTSIYQTIETRICEMIKHLKAGEFIINPLPAYGNEKDSKSCKYCNYSNICYNKNNKGGLQ